MFGPAPDATQLEALHHAWADASSPSAKLETGLALAQLGDFTGRAELLDTYSGDIAWLGREEKLRLLDLILATATEYEATDDCLFVLPDNDDGSVYAGSGRVLLARAATVRYVELARVFDEIHDITFEVATDSGFDLSGVEFDLYDEDSTVDAWAGEMTAALADVPATYVFRGAEFTPQIFLDEFLEGVDRAAAGGPVLIRPNAELLATCSGLAHPTIGSTVGPDDVAAFTEYAERLLALPWRAGVKYFYGHDVDGGPGLHR
ncbi:hypothetical protein [Pseudoclavibacter sp. JSM 162008]|uniref:hypothetical protein n=1 Tax=Pseudoclavibacter sp. JSM 162008 TaxID=3229855 RepID=UPI0035243609